jgi:hypothetical protein
VKSNQVLPERITVVPDVSRKVNCISVATPEKGESPPAFGMLSFGSIHLEEKRRESQTFIGIQASSSDAPYCKLSPDKKGQVIFYRMVLEYIFYKSS